MALVASGCVASVPDHATTRRAADLVREASDCTDDVDVDEVGPRRFAIAGCGFVGVYRCRWPRSAIEEARERLAGRLGSLEGCEPVAAGADAYRAAIGDWVFAGARPVATAEPPPRRTTEPRPTASVDAPEPPDPADVALREAMDAHARGILACAGASVLAMRVRWDADCRVTYEPQHDDPDVQGCIAALLHDVPRAPCDAAGSLLHVVREPR